VNTHLPRPVRRSPTRRRAVAGLAASTAAVITMILPTVGVELAAATPARAVPASAPTAPAVRAEAADAAHLKDFFDTAIPSRLAKYHVPGATVSVVSAGKKVFSAGYGLADVEDRTPFDPGTSLVRIASVTKLFTATAVMQLVQQGKLDLHADVNRYLRTFRIPATYPRPITLDDLLSHTAGFEDLTVGIGARSQQDVPPLGTYLADHLPARIRPPGEVSAYSNYGAALAGYIVSQVSGEPYDQYVQRYLLDPLEMRHTTASEPVPADLAAGQARSYDDDAGTYRRKPFVFDDLGPDGSISATADDMANFMIAHLDDGRFGDTRILDQATAELMHSRSFAADPRLDGYAHGFKEQTVNGHRVIGHDGSWEGFETAVLLVPDARLGLFVSTNSPGGIDAVTELLPAFFDHVLPGSPATDGRSPDPRPARTAQAARPATPVPGFYQPARHNASTIEKVLTLTTSLRLSVGPDGGISFAGKTWTPIGKGVYQQAGGSQRLVFVSGSDGARYAVTDGPTYQLVPWPATIPVNLALLAAFAVLALSAVLGLPLTAGVRRLRHRTPAMARGWRTARVLAALAAGSGLLFVVLFLLVLVGDTSILYGMPARVRVLLLLPPLVAGLTIAAGIVSARTWRGGRGGHGGRPSRLARVHQVGMLLALTGLCWFCWQWNLFGWQF